MARKQRITYPGYYHIINRGVERRSIFLEDEDYDKFLDCIKEMLKKFNITLHTYCLMTNHYHLLLQTHEENISKAIQYLNSYYSIYFNRKYRRTGHLWQGRFLSYFLYDDEQSWIVAKYIERNPIEAKMVKYINHYRYQSFYQWKYGLEQLQLLEGSIIFDMTLNEYERYINLEMEQSIFDLVYTTPKLVEKDGEIRVLYKRLKTFFNEDIDIDRDRNIQRAYAYGYTKTEIANFLSLSTKTISKSV
jgi:REP element-mobilizing transposase RayT